MTGCRRTGPAIPMLDVTPTGWAATLAVIAGLLALDWYVLGRRPHAISIGEAARWSILYIAVAVLFGVAFGLLNGWDLGGQYFAGYVVEKSLSVDNLFVFVLIIGSFAVPVAQQPKALSIGIGLALALRAAFIAAGAALLDLFAVMFLLFGAALIATAVQLFRHRDQDPQVEDNLIVTLARRSLPVSDDYDEGRIITRREGQWMATPLFLALLAIGSSDLLFAFDSIPAVFGVTDHAYVVFAANAFALLGLRPLFFLVSGLLDRLVYMSTGLSVILAFIGIKLVLEFAHHEQSSIPQISTAASLAVILTALAVTTTASLAKATRDPNLRAHAGSLTPPRSSTTIRDETPATRHDPITRATSAATQSDAAHNGPKQRPESQQ
jgi:tellurite resistance protein TerC